MKMNVGSTDSFVRVMLGIVFYTNIFALQPSLGAIGTIILFALGTICMVTAWTQSCPAYGKLGINTCSVNENQCSCSCSGKCE